MIETKMGAIYENACRLAGREPSVLTPPVGWPVIAAMAINAGIRALAAEKFPIMQRVEFRRYRPDWKDGTSYAAGNEVWHGDDYWRMEDTASQGEPGVADGWRKLEMTEVAAFVAFEQPWENTVIDSAGFDINRFAYVSDPKYHPTATPCKVVGLHEMGVELAAPAPKGVFCKFIPEYPQIEFTEWTPGTMYQAGAIVYRTSTKDVYQCEIDITDEVKSVAPEADEQGYWTPVRIRQEFAAYLTRIAAADLMTEDQGKYQTRAAAETEFERLQERYHEGNGEQRVRTGRFI